MSWLRAGKLRNCDSNPGVGNILVFRHIAHTGSVNLPISYSVGYERCFLHVVPRVRMCGVTSPLPHMPSWLGDIQGVLKLLLVLARN